MRVAGDRVHPQLLHRFGTGRIVRSKPLQLAAQVTVDLVGEDVEATGDESGGTVGMPTGAAATHLVDPARNPRPIAAFPPGEANESVGDRRESVNAGTALACALAGEVASDAGEFDDAAGLLGQGDHGARPQRDAVCMEVGIEQTQSGKLDSPQPRAEVAADKDGLQGLGETIALSEEIVEGGAERDLIYAARLERHR